MGGVEEIYKLTVLVRVICFEILKKIAPIAIKYVLKIGILMFIFTRALHIFGFEYAVLLAAAMFLARGAVKNG